MLPDVDLSVHPAPIDQPTVVPIASAQTGKTSVLQCAQASKRLCVCDGVTFCTSAWPSLQCAVELIKNWVKCRLVKLPIIIDPATYYRIKHAGQILNGLVGHSVHPPISDCSAHGFGCLIANGWKKTHEEFPITIF